MSLQLTYNSSKFLLLVLGIATNMVNAHNMLVTGTNAQGNEVLALLRNVSTFTLYSSLSACINF